MSFILRCNLHVDSDASDRSWPRDAALLWVLSLSILGCDRSSNRDGNAREIIPQDGAFHVHPGEQIQPVLDAAANSRTKKVMVHEGTYRPEQSRQALIWFNERHDGIQLIADGKVTLRAENPEAADPKSDSYPAIVNHVVYFGDGISKKTVMRGFRIRGANGFVTRDESVPIQPDLGVKKLEKAEFFYSDGGGIKIFGRSYPTFEELDIVDNFARPCGGGVSVEHRGFNEQSATFTNCIFRDNRCQLTGSGVDVLPGSAATFTNCLFLNNVSNLGEDDISPEGKSYNSENGSGALTVFPGSRVIVEHCTFTGNWNGVDDKGSGNTYRNSIFWQNTREGGTSAGKRYEMDILNSRNVENCYLAGEVVDLRDSIDESKNVLKAPAPNFGEDFTPHSPEYSGIGYRPTGRFSLSASNSDSATRPSD